MRFLKASVVMLAITLHAVTSLPFLPNEAKEDFDKSRKALMEMQNQLKKVITSLENDNKKIVNSVQKQLGLLTGSLTKHLGTITSSVGNQFGGVKSALGAVAEKMEKTEQGFRLLGKDLKSKYKLMNCGAYGPFPKTILYCIINLLLKHHVRGVRVVKVQKLK